MGYKTLFEQIKTVCAWNSLRHGKITLLLIQALESCQEFFSVVANCAEIMLQMRFVAKCAEIMLEMGVVTKCADILLQNVRCHKMRTIFSRNARVVTAHLLQNVP